jgi:hypothetical protein
MLLFYFHVAVPHLPLLVARCCAALLLSLGGDARLLCSFTTAPTGVLHGAESLKLLLILGINFGIASLCVDECVTTRKAGVAATWAFGCYVRGILIVVLSIVAAPSILERAQFCAQSDNSAMFSGSALKSMHAPRH